MNATTNHFRSATRMGAAVAGSVLLLALAGCSAPATGVPKAGAYSASGAELTDEQREACESIFARSMEGAAGPSIVVVVDQTASTAPAPMSASLVDAIGEGSMADASLTLIAVGGEGEAPRIVAKQVALSTAGERDRPSVRDLAQVMPSCVAGVLLPQAVPQAPGTDLHAAVALMSELSDASSQLFIESDFISTSGAFALDESSLALTPETVSQQVVSAAPVDLHGAVLKVNGVGNTSTALLTADREWLRDLSRELCAAWNATGCADIDVSPVNAEVHEGPADPIPAFPRTTVTVSAGVCTYESPASITFAGDSFDLRDDAADVFAEPIELMLKNPPATATITGHTASSGDYTTAELIELAEKRAAAVAELFSEEGISGERLVVRGVGDTEPKVEDIDAATGLQIEAAAAIERRVDIKIEGALCEA